VPITSFQYQDVGIKIDIEPRVHHNKEVTLKLTIEVSNLNGVVNGSNGQTQPIIGTRTITSTIRLKDGETNFLAGLIRTDNQRTKTSLPFLGDLPIIGHLFSDNKTDYKRTDLFLTLTPHIIRAPQITEEDMLPIWVGTENNVSFSGLNTRLESPNATGSPFETSTEGGRPVRPTPVTPVHAPASTLPPGMLQGGGPNDPFKRDVKPAPTPQPRSQSPRSELRGTSDAVGDTAGLSSSLASSVASALEASPDPAVLAPREGGGPLLALATTAPEIAPGQFATVSLSGLSGLKDTGALELTLEWDARVADVTGIVAGPWRDEPDGGLVRFEAERGTGRARLQFGRPTGTIGLPEGALALLTVRGVAPGTTLFRVSAGASVGRSGAAPPAAESVSFTVRR
jgi:hypothetical protein